MAEISKEKIAALLKQYEAALTLLVSGRDWKRLLDVMACMDRYSFRNCVLIHAHTPKATGVRTRKGWKAKGCQLRKDEKAIRVLVSKGTNGKKDLLRILRVFDISQTKSKPTFDGALTKDKKAFNLLCQSRFNRLRKWLKKHHNIQVRWASKPGSLDSAYGIQPTGPLDGPLSAFDSYALTIDINAQATPQESLCGLICETAAYLTDIKSLPPERFELIATSTAYLACKTLKLKGPSYRFSYVAKWSGGDSKVIEESAQRIREQAYKIVGIARGSAAANAVQAMEALGKAMEGPQKAMKAFAQEAHKLESLAMEVLPSKGLVTKY